MRDLAEQVGMKAASLYSHYPGGKDDLLVSALGPFLDGLDALVAGNSDDSDDSDDLELDLEAWLCAYATHLAGHAAAVRLAGADLAVARHGRVGEQLSDLNTRARRLLRHHRQVSEVEAAAILGRLWWPIICLPHPVAEADLKELAAAAARD